MFDFTFYRGKKILITGHTGFKGSYMCEVLLKYGAKLYGYALDPPTDPSLFMLCGLQERMDSVQGDIRDLAHLKRVFEKVQPEIVIHMAAQPIVRESYQRPVETFETNVMGTVNLLECCRLTESVKSVVNVTTDKVYRNMEWSRGYVETDVLDGYDPYSNSKSCSELVTHSYIRSFFQGQRDIAVSTCRAGNVIGGGDFARDRIIPDCIRAMERGEEIIVRNPSSIRPYQHVLEPVCAYLMVAMEQHKDPLLADCYNVGPEDADCCTTGELVDIFCKKWNEKRVGEENRIAAWKNRSDQGPHEAGLLRLDCDKIKRTFGWMPRWNIEAALEEVVRFAKGKIEGRDILALLDDTIDSYLMLDEPGGVII
ncbi:MAG: CDP-glucose 4,6-dehydratase [Lachnospiraceae bacterium]|nr:CDP-glucose 4,6-dehydratase [Lachnospiraceae bacterium]